MGTWCSVLFSSGTNKNCLQRHLRLGQPRGQVGDNRIPLSLCAWLSQPVGGWCEAELGARGGSKGVESRLQLGCRSQSATTGSKLPGSGGNQAVKEYQGWEALLLAPGGNLRSSVPQFVLSISIAGLCSVPEWAPPIMSREECPGWDQRARYPLAHTAV